MHWKVFKYLMLLGDKLKPRTLPHLNLVPSSWEAFDGFNTPAVHQLLGHFQTVNGMWYQRRRSDSGATFRIRGYGELNSDVVARWLDLEHRLAEYVETALINMIEPWEAPDTLNCNELWLETLSLKPNDSFELWFDGPYCRINHEMPVAYFKSGRFLNIEWST